MALVLDVAMHVYPLRLLALDFRTVRRHRGAVE